MVVWLSWLACTREDVPPPTLAILSPAEGASVPVGEVAVSVVVENFELSEPMAHATPGPLLPPWLAPSVALAHGEEGEIPFGYCALALDGAAALDLTSPQGTLTGVAAGAHTLDAELFHVDGDRLDPPVTATVSFTAQ